MYYIYHIPGIKIGCTTNVQKRTHEQGYNSYEIIEEYTDIYKASRREIELQREYELPVDSKSYWKTIRDQHNWNIEDSRKGQRTQARNRRKLNFEDAEEIRLKYIPKVYTYGMLAEEYNCSSSIIRGIVRNMAYLTP